MLEIWRQNVPSTLLAAKENPPTPFSAKETDVGPKPFQRPLLISLSFSSPVFSSTTVVGVDIGFGLKLRKIESRPRKVSKARGCWSTERLGRRYALVILGYT